MRKNLAIALLIMLSSFGIHTNANNTWFSATREHVEIPRSTDWVTTIRLPDENKIKISKKDLKDEIKRRKKHHKALLSIYNESFDSEYLNLIQENSARLTRLRELLKA